MKFKAEDTKGHAEGTVEDEDALAMVPAKYHEHLNRIAFVSEVEFAYEGDVIEVRGYRGAVVVHVHGGFGKRTEYHYRGRTIVRREGVSSGYYGAWASGKHWSDSFEGCKRYIDSRLDA